MCGKQWIAAGLVVVLVEIGGVAQVPSVAVVPQRLRVSGKVVDEETTAPVTEFKLGVFKEAQGHDRKSPWPLTVLHQGRVLRPFHVWHEDGLRRLDVEAQEVRFDPETGLPAIIHPPFGLMVEEAKVDSDPNYDFFIAETFSRGRFYLVGDYLGADAAKEMSEPLYLLVRAKGYEPYGAGPYDAQALPKSIGIRLKRTKGLDVAVLTPGGTPAVKAAVLIAGPSFVSFTNRGEVAGRLAIAHGESSHMEPDAGGKLRLSPEQASQGFVWAWNDDGFGVAGLDALKQTPVLQMRRYGRLDVLVHEGQRPAVGSVIAVKVIPGVQGVEDGGINVEPAFMNSLTAQTDSSGRAVFPGLPPGKVVIYRAVGAGRRLSYVGFAEQEIRPGGTHRVEHGVGGVSVVGKVQFPHPIPGALVPSFGCFRVVTDGAGDALGNGILKGTMGYSRRGNAFDLLYPVRVQADGRFRVDGVREGDSYQLKLDFFDATAMVSEVRVFARAESHFVALEKSVDLGTLTLRYPPRVIAIGEVVPSLSFTDGLGTRRSFGDFLGRDVLVIIGDPDGIEGVLMQAEHSPPRGHIAVVQLALPGAIRRGAFSVRPEHRRESAVVRGQVSSEELRGWLEQCGHSMEASLLLVDARGKLAAANMRVIDAHARLAGVRTGFPPGLRPGTPGR